MRSTVLLVLIVAPGILSLPVEDNQLPDPVLSLFTQTNQDASSTEFDESNCANPTNSGSNPQNNGAACTPAGYRFLGNGICVDAQGKQFDQLHRGASTFDRCAEESANLEGMVGLYWNSNNKRCYALYPDGSLPAASGWSGRNGDGGSGAVASFTPSPVGVCYASTSYTSDPTSTPILPETQSPTRATAHPSRTPTHAPTSQPTPPPTHVPTSSPTHTPSSISTTNAPTKQPTHSPTRLSYTHPPSRVPTSSRTSSRARRRKRPTSSRAQRKGQQTGQTDSQLATDIGIKAKVGYGRRRRGRDHRHIYGRRRRMHSHNYRAPPYSSTHSANGR